MAAIAKMHSRLRDDVTSKFRRFPWRVFRLRVGCERPEERIAVAKQRFPSSDALHRLPQGPWPIAANPNVIHFTARFGAA